MIKKITFDTYPITLHVFIDISNEDIQSYIGLNKLEYFEPILEFDIDTEHGCFVYTDEYSHIYLRFKDLTKPEAIAHEAFHATCYIMRFIGSRLSKNSEEAYAYLLQYIIENIND